jgi:NitT/TauT family transport system substrate-binding protein
MKLTGSVLGRAAVPLVLAMGLAACGGGDSTEPSAEEGAEQTQAFTVGFTTAGVPSVGLLAAIDELREQGYTIETPEVAEPELLIEGIVNGEFQFSSETTTAALLGAQLGGDVKVIADLALNSWTLYGDEEITSCADLDGKRLAIHSQAGVSTALVRNYIASECPDASPDYLVIAGSPNRYAALLAGEIDASPLELADAIALENEAGDRFSQLTSFAESLPTVHPTAVYGSGSFMAENPALVEDLLAGLLEQNRQIAADPAYLEGLIEEYLGEIPHSEEVAARYSELFPVNGGLDEQAVADTIDFAVDAEVIEPGLTVEEAADLSYLDAALERIGEE